MRAGFQRDIGRSTARRITCLGQGHRFRMGPAAKLRPSATDHSAVHDHTAHRRIGPSGPQSPRPKAQGMGHVVVVRTMVRMGVVDHRGVIAGGLHGAYQIAGAHLRAVLDTLATVERVYGHTCPNFLGDVMKEKA